MKSTLKTLAVAAMVSAAALMSSPAFAVYCVQDVCFDSWGGGTGKERPDPEATTKDQMRKAKAACMAWNLAHPTKKKDCSVFD